MGTSWTSDLLTGHELIDEQHQKLFVHFNELYELIRVGKGQDEILSMIEFLEEYIKFHFDSEMELQEKSKYPGAEDHKRLHAIFKKQVSIFSKELKENGVDDKLLLRVNLTIVDWIRVHIGEEDKKFVKYLNSL
ncbi:MAG: hemerythrin family protein [Acidaminobacteraceae bacterium]